MDLFNECGVRLIQVVGQLLRSTPQAQASRQPRGECSEACYVCEDGAAGSASGQLTSFCQGLPAVQRQVGQRVLGTVSHAAGGQCGGGCRRLSLPLIVTAAAPLTAQEAAPGYRGPLLPFGAACVLVELRGFEPLTF